MKERKRIGKIQELIYELKIRDAARAKVITADPDTPMSALRHILKENRISGVPILENGKLVGVISIEDFITWLSDGAVDCPVRDRMTRHVETLLGDEPLIHALSRIEETGFGRFPVVERDTHHLIGILTKGDIIESLLHKLEVDYHTEEIHRYRASHIFEDILADQTKLVFQSHVKAGDFDRAGRVSSELKRTLNRLGLHPDCVRRTAIAAYEAEMNIVIHTTEGADVCVEVDPRQIRIDIRDNGPGIADVKKARTSGFSTAPEWVRELGFGAGMGLSNIERCSDAMEMTSILGEGTHLSLIINTTVNSESVKSERERLP